MKKISPILSQQHQSNAEHTYDVQILSSVQEIVDATEEWQTFLKKYAGRHSFWQDPYVIRFHHQSHEQSEPRIILLRRNGKLECIAPCLISQTKFKLNFSVFNLPSPQVRILKIIDSDIVFAQTAVKKKCLKTIFKSLKRLRANFDIIYLENLRDNSPIKNFFFDNRKDDFYNFKLKITSYKPEKARQHTLCDSYDAWLKTLRGKTRGKILRKVRSLYKNYPNQVNFTKITNTKCLPEFIKYLNELYPKTWQARTFGPKKRNSKNDNIFLTNIARKGWLRSYLLHISDKPVAFLIAFQYNDVFLHAECGYDPEFSKQGVGSVLNYLMLQDLYELNKPDELDFGFGENEYKKILGNRANNAFEAYITQPNLLGFLVRVQQYLNHLEERIRQFLIKSRLDNVIRKILKRK